MNSSLRTGESNMGDISATSLVVTPREGVDAELVAIGQEYWSLAEVTDDHRPQWKTAVRDIDTQRRESAHVIAAAAVSAELPGVFCRTCEQPLRPTSRTQFAEALSGTAVTCVNCDEPLQERIAQLLNPDAHKEQKRREEQERKQHQAEYEQRTREWQTQCRQMVEDVHSDALRPNASIPTSNVVAEVTALTVLRFAPNIAPITPIDAWSHDFPYHPAGLGKQVATMLQDARQAGLLEPHSRSRLNAFVWEPQTFREAYREAAGDFEQLAPPQLTDRYFPLSVSWHVPYGPSTETAVQHVDEHLSWRLDPANMTAQRQQYLLEAATATLIAEAQRYFAHQLDYRKLPPVAENHQPRLDEAIAQAVNTRPLGTVYYLAWLATKTAAAQAHSQPRIPKEKMTTHAVNRFQHDVQRARDEADYAPTVFDAPIGCPLSAFTRTLFYNALEMDPVKILSSSIHQHLPPPAARVASTPDDEESGSPETVGFRTGTTNWITFSGPRPSQLLRQAGHFLAEWEEHHQSPTITSLRWDSSDDGYRFTMFVKPTPEEPPLTAPEGEGTELEA